MSLTPSKVTWDPNRYKAHEYVITYDSNGNPTLSKKEADYTGVNYNFASLPSGTSTTSQTQTGTTVQSGTTTQQQTSEAFGDVKPYYWDDKDNDAGNKELTGSGYGGAQPPDNTILLYSQCLSSCKNFVSYKFCTLAAKSLGCACGNIFPTPL